MEEAAAGEHTDLTSQTHGRTQTHEEGPVGRKGGGVNSIKKRREDEQVDMQGSQVGYRDLWDPGRQSMSRDEKMIAKAEVLLLLQK